MNVAVPVRVNRNLLHLADTVRHFLDKDRVGLQIALLSVQVLLVEAGGVCIRFALKKPLIALPLLMHIEKGGGLLFIQIQR